LPDWTRLEFKQCPNCPLKPKDSPRCPVAVSLVEVVEFFKDHPSTDIVETTIITAEREYHGTKSLQKALSSLMGLHMATSGCPILDRLRPMALTHTPFSTPQEAMYRSISMYLMAQFLIYKRGKKPDWDLQKLVEMYDEIFSVNKAFIQRII